MKGRNVIGFRTDAAREIAGDEEKGGRQIVASQLRLACDELDRMRQRDEILREELKILRRDVGALEIFAATWLAQTCRYHDLVEECGEGIVTDFVKDVVEVETTEEALMALIIDRVEMTEGHISLADRMVERFAPGFNMTARISRVTAERNNADLGCPCALCTIERAKQDLKKGAGQ